MLFEIDHLTRYRYSVPVQLGEHLLRFLPPFRAGQRPVYCRVDIDPLPSYREEITDAWGNRVERVWFHGETGHLEVRAHLEVETQATNGPALCWLPPGYGAAAAGLAPYLEPLDDPASLQPLVQPLLDASGNDGLAFLAALNTAVHAYYHRGVRLDGPPHTPAQTLALGEGVCRDLTVLFMAAARLAGFATRFVSGYQQGDGTRQVRYLHAWPEVCLPGGDWRGYDPTHGTSIGADHVAVAAAPTAAAVTPLEGGYSFQGTLLNSTLDTDIRITSR